MTNHSGHEQRSIGMRGHAALRHCGQLIPFSSVCRGCETRRLCLPCDLDEEQERRLRAALRRTASFRRGDRIFAMGAPFNALHIVKDGAVKTQQLTVDGNVSLTGFFLEGDLLGLDAIGSATHPCEAVALQATTTCALRYGEFERLCAQIPPLQHWLLHRLGSQLKAFETLSSWTARKQLTTRVLSFFLDLQQRLAVRQKPLAGYYRMPMRKCDIALFLNITPETLSRTLGVLRSNRQLDIRGQTFRLTDVTRVRRFVGA